MVLALPGATGSARAFGAVVRIARSEGTPRLGVEFLILHGDSRPRIEAFVESIA
jgi:hypothetical protein